MCKPIKVLGKWFFQQPKTLEERMEFYKTNIGIVEDVMCEQDALDFAAKLKSVVLRSSNSYNQFYFFFPNYGKNEVGYLFQGHHSLHDGRTVLQSLFKTSDDPDSQPYPFLKLTGPNIFQWIFMYLTFPYKFITVMKCYYKTKSDNNVVKKHVDYLSGDIRSRNAITLSTPKVKSMAKKHKITINDLMMTLA